MTVGESDDPTSALIGALEAEAELVDEGTFSVDLREAGDKLRRFRLAEPALWIVLLVEVATMLGAKVIRFEFGHRSLTAEIDGPNLSEAELRGLSVVTGSSRSELGRDEALGVLAVAYQAAVGRGAERLLITSGCSSSAGARLLWTQAKGESIMAGSSGGHDGIVVELELDDDEPEDCIAGERDQLLRRCRYARIDVIVDDKQIAWGWREAFVPASHDVVLLGPSPRSLRVEGEVAGLVGQAFERDEGSHMLLLIHGVLVEEVFLGEEGGGFVAVVEAPWLRRDLSLGKVTRDAGFERVVHAVEEQRKRWIREFGGSAWVERGEPRGESGCAIGVVVMLCGAGLGLASLALT